LNEHQLVLWLLNHSALAAWATAVNTRLNAVTRVTTGFTLTRLGIYAPNEQGAKMDTVSNNASQQET